MASPSPASWTSTSSRTTSSCAIRTFALTSGRAIVSTSPAKAGRRIDSSLRSPRARGEATNTGHAGGPDRAVLRPNHATLRLRSGRWRFRYDILGQEIVLHYCGLRREDTYD